MLGVWLDRHCSVADSPLPAAPPAARARNETANSVTLPAGTGSNATRYDAAHDWPGNVRELKNSVARLAVADHPFHADEVASPRSPVWRAPPGDFPPLADARRRSQDDFERAYLEETLRLCDGNVTRAAELAGVSRQQMTRLLARHGLRGRDRS